jgi:hypothetical protein
MQQHQTGTRVSRADAAGQDEPCPEEETPANLEATRTSSFDPAIHAPTDSLRLETFGVYSVDLMFLGGGFLQLGIDLNLVMGGTMP